MTLRYPDTSAAHRLHVNSGNDATYTRKRLAYMRISADDQNIGLQEDLIEQYGYDDLFSDVESGSVLERGDYQNLILEIEHSATELGPEIIVYRLERLGRDPIELISIFSLMERKNALFTSLTEPWLTHWNEGPMEFLIWWQQIGFARFELLLLKDRQARGITSKQRAVMDGRDRWNGRGPDKKPRKRKGSQTK